MPTALCMLALAPAMLCACGGAQPPAVAPATAAPIEWITLPGGAFQMGARGRLDTEPVRTVTVPSFQLSKTEVTVGQYRACVDAAVCTKPTPGHRCNWETPGHDAHPVNCVRWDQAYTFAQWAGARLPSEAEWEYAARSGGQDQAYPWGEAAARCAVAVMSEGGLGCGTGHTLPVCSKPQGHSAHGVCDLAGNVWEWVADWHDSYAEAPTDGSPQTDRAQHRVFRGGSWLDEADLLKATYRGWNRASTEGALLGFRLARRPP